MFGRTGGAGRLALRFVTMAVTVVLLGAVATTADAATRTLKFYNLHTREKASFDYKRNGRYDASELKKINWFMRDWRKGKSVEMDTRLLDLIWEAYRQSGSNDYIHVICGYRSPATNKMLRSRSSGVAKKSQHTLGRALDFYIPDVPLKKMREIGLKMQVGGVGYYPRSGSPFVHFDVGNARHWPRMSRKELVAVFPKGGTVHVPSDGKPLPGYQQALASYKARRSRSEIQVANASSSSSGGGKSLIAMLFGGGEDEAEDNADTTAPARAAPARREAPVQVAAVVPTPRPSRDLPAGVAVAVPDRFDTGPSAVSQKPEPEQTVVASLDPARIPVPTFAPSRGEPQVASDEVGALVAAAEKNDDQSAVAGQLAYAVPTPTDRPNFDSVLKKSEPKAEKAEQAVAALSALASRQERNVAAVLPQDRPEPRDAKKAGQERAVPAGMMAASFGRKAEPKRSSETLVRAAALASDKQGAGFSGKGGRVLQDAVGRAAKPAPKTIAPQEAIASRIQLASLVQEQDKRVEEIRSVEPSAGRLVGNLPQVLIAKGFTVAESDAATDRFAGSAVTFLPTVKIAR